MNILQRIKCAAVVGLTLLSPLFATDASAAPPASFTTVNSTADGPGHCFNGGDPSDSVNCNIYDGKQYVWLNGGPVAAWGGAGQYFFVVMIPSGQGNPNDGNGSLLSFWDTVDPYTNRTFTLDADGNVTYTGTHDVDGTRIRLGIAPDWYETTSNNGGEYIIGVCKMPVGTEQPVSPSQCKYDAFKLVEIEPPDCPCGARDPVTGLCPAECPCLCSEVWNPELQQCVFVKECETPGDPHLTIFKTAAGTYSQVFGWDIAKIRQGDAVRYLLSGSATVAYQVNVTKSETVSDVAVSGEIFIINDGTAPSNSNVVEDTLGESLTGTCVVDSTNFVSIPVSAEGVSGTYTCDLADLLPGIGPHVNNVAVAYDTTQGPDLAEGFAAVVFTPTIVGSACADLADLWVATGDSSAPGGIGSVCASTEIAYERIIPVQSGCVVYDNTASVTPAEGTGDTASATVTVCGPVDSGAHTIGFWQNKNGQGLIKNATSSEGACDVYWFLTEYAPFADLKTGGLKNCAQTAAWVYSVIKAANSGGAAMNPMLKAQMLGSALSSYFFPGVNSFEVDLTKVWLTQDTSAAFGGATCMTVPDLLAWASAEPQYFGPPPGNWYDQNKGMQALAKNTFDAINNEAVFECAP